MTSNPALVTKDAAQRLPRWVLWCFTAAYLIPGVLGRDPWRNAELTAYAVMLSLAEGRTEWLQPAVAQVQTDIALPAVWLGAVAIRALDTVGIDPVLSARLPFVGLLGLTLWTVWHASYRLARTTAAQPLAFAFGGEAHPTDYAVALADCSVLALMATLGVLQLGHEATPEILPLACMGSLMWALSSPEQHRSAAALVVVGVLPLLAAAGAPEMSLACAAAAALVCWKSTEASMRRLLTAIVCGSAIATLSAVTLDTWRSDWSLPGSTESIGQLLRLLAWFTWPTAVLASVTLWQWRHHWVRRHVAVPGLLFLVPVVATALSGGSDRVLLTGVPGLAVLAAFSLPTIRRRSTAAIEWFSVFFFSLLAAVLWGIYLSLQTGWPAAPARNAAQVAPEYQSVFQGWALCLGIAATGLWIWLVRWRTARHPPRLWRSLILPASGVLLNWLLAMSLLLHPLDYTRGLTPWVNALKPVIGPVPCIVAPAMPLPYAAALESQGGWQVDARPEVNLSETPCPVLVLTEPKPGTPGVTVPQGWLLAERVRRPTERYNAALIYRRAPGDTSRPGVAN